jgi:capsid protein
VSGAATKNGKHPDGTYARKGRRQAPPREQTTLREQASFVRDERLLERGLLPKDREASFAAARPSTFRRQRVDLGGEADAHTRNESEFWRLRELSRSMDRDDVVPGPVVEAKLDLVLGGSGIQMDPQTGFPDLNRAIKEDLEEQGQDPKRFDLAGRWTARMSERLVLRHVMFDGDKLVILHWDGEHAGKVQLVEGDRLAGHDGPNGNILHGVEVDPDTAAIVAFYVLKRRPANRKQTGYRAPTLPTVTIEGKDDPASPYIKVPAFDAAGRPQALLVLDPKRSTETRSVTAWHRVFDILGMEEDSTFATVAGLQGVACIPMAITTDGDVKLGKREEADSEETGDDDVDAPPFEELTPNTLPRLRPGESLAGAPKAGPGPDAEAFHHRIDRRIAMQVGLPYSLAFRDTSHTVFHGYRGETEQAKRAAEWAQEFFPALYSRPVYLFRLHFALERLKKVPELAALIAQADAKGTLRRVTAQLPAWPYVDPKTDREADAFGIEHSTDSPRAILASRGRDIDEVRRERHEDIAAERTAAKKAATDAGEPDEWRAYCATWALGLPLPGAPAPAPPAGGSNAPA